MIDFLSRSPYPDSEDPYQQYPYTESQVPSSSPGEFSPYPSHYAGYPVRDYGEGYRDWPRDKPAGNDRKAPGEDSSGANSGYDDPYRRGRDQYMPKALRSRSGSASDLHVKGETTQNQEESGEDTSSHLHDLGNPNSGSVDSGIHLHAAGKKLPDGPRGERDIHKGNRRSQELSFDFSKGFGPLIPSERHSGYGVDMLQESPDYKELYQRISDSDSDDHSG